MKDSFANGSLTANDSNTTIDNLNKSTFTKKELNIKSYYLAHGFQTPKLKKEIEKNIKTKFKEKSDILDQFEWSDDNTNLFIYTMLKKEFEYKYSFTKQASSPFNGKGEYEYFGYSKGDNEKILDNITIIHYDENKTIIKLTTKGNDELYFYKGYEGSTFKEIYDEISAYEVKKEYYEKSVITKVLIPYINIKDMTEIKDVENTKLITGSGSEILIEKALQTLEVELNEVGGKVKSEAAISFKNSAAIEEYKLLFNTNFVMFIKEKEANLPYLALKVDNLDKYQTSKKD